MEFTGLGLPLEASYESSRLTRSDFFHVHGRKTVFIIITVVVLAILVFILTYLLLRRHGQSEEQRFPSNFSSKELHCSSYSFDLDVIKSLPTSVTILNETDYHVIQFRNSAGINERKQVLQLYFYNTNIAPQVYCLLNLRELTIDSNTSWRIPSEIGNLTRLERLALTNIAGERIPSTIGKLKMLRYLKLGGNDLQELPEECAALTRLVSLEIDANLKTMPSFISMLPIRRLRFTSYTRFAVIPSNFFQNLKPHLRSLSIGVSHPSTLERLWELTNLRSLLIYADVLLELPMSLTRVTSLRALLLRGTFNQIKFLPQNLTSLPLRNLELAGNAFGEIPPILANCSTLVLLNLTNNKIRNISAVLTKTSQLRSLILSGNQITRIPTEITHLTKTLVALELSSNMLETVPAEELMSMEKLNYLNIRNNFIPEEELVRLKRIFSTKPKLKVDY